MYTIGNNSHGTNPYKIPNTAIACNCYTTCYHNSLTDFAAVTNTHANTNYSPIADLSKLSQIWLLNNGSRKNFTVFAYLNAANISQRKSASIQSCILHSPN